MRKQLIVAASALALMTGAAFAQSSSGSSGAAGGTATPGATTQHSTGGAAATSSTTQSQSTMQSGAAGQTLASADKMMGKNVYGQNNEKIGEVEDIILDPQSGQAKQLVLSSGGFLGIGDKKVAVDFSKAKFDQQQDRVQISDMTQDQVKSMPEFKYTDNMQSMNRRSSTGSTNGNTAGSGSSAGSTTGATGTTGSSGTAAPPASGTSQQPKQ